MLTEELEGFFDITRDVTSLCPGHGAPSTGKKSPTTTPSCPPQYAASRSGALPKGEQNVLKLIIARTLMAVSKPFRYLETLLTTECAGEEFTAKGKEVLEEGWKAVERKVLANPEPKTGTHRPAQCEQKTSAVS